MIHLALLIVATVVVLYALVFALIGLAYLVGLLLSIAIAPVELVLNAVRTVRTFARNWRNR
jgi:hypothetical protein